MCYSYWRQSLQAEIASSLLEKKKVQLKNKQTNPSLSCQTQNIFLRLAISCSNERYNSQ